MPQISREEYEKLSPYDAWIHRMRFGEPAGGSPVKLDHSGNTFMKNTVPALAESAAGVFPGLARILSGSTAEAPSKVSSPPSDYGAAFGPKVDDAVEPAGTARSAPRVPAKPAVSPSQTLSELLGGRNIDSFRQIKPAPQPNRLDAIRFQADPKLHDATMKSERRQRGREQMRGVLGLDADPTRTSGFRPEKRDLQAETDKMYEAIQSGPVPDITTPEETMINTHMDTQRGIIAGNNAAREGRRSYIPDAASEEQNTASRLRNKLTGQVDEMSNLGGGRGQMLMALADRDHVDLSSPEGRRAAFGAAPKVGNVAPYAGGTTTDKKTGEVTRTAQRQRMLNRKQAVRDYDAKRRGAAASGIDAASEGAPLEDVLRGLPASAQRGARRAYMAEQQRQKAVEAEKALIEAGQQQGGAQTDPRIGPLLAQLENPLTSPEERERASQMLNWIIAGMGGG